MRISHLFALALVLVSTQASYAFECYGGDVDAASVKGLRQPAKLFFLAPNRDVETGQLKIVGPGVRAESSIQWIAGQPIEYVFDALTGSFVRGASEGGGTTLVVRNSRFEIIRYDGRRVVIVDENASNQPLGDKIYEVRPIGDLDCTKIFPQFKQTK